MKPGATDVVYTVLGVREDGVIPAVELLACESDEVALKRAVSWLSTHASCSRAQVWRDSVLIGEVTPSSVAAG